MNRRQSVSLLQASHESPMLARLAELGRDSVARLKTIEPLIPVALRGSVRAGPIEGTVWCLLVDNSAAAARLRQILPALEAHLRSSGWDVDSIRLKVQITR
jgi:hypothetical protein